MIQEIKKSILNWKMFGSVLCAFVILMNPFLFDNSWSQMKEMDVLYWITLPMATSGFTPFACVFPIIPYGLGFVEEYNTGCIKSVLPRSGRTNYIKSKILSCMISGGCSIMAAFSMVFLFCMIGGSVVTQNSISEFYVGTIWEPYLLIWGGKLVLLLKLVLAFAHGAVWALIALLVSCFCTNRYATIMVPFAFYQITWHLLQGKAYNPVYLLRGDWAGYSCWYEPLLIQVSVIGILVLLNAICLRRKLYEI